MKDLLFGPSSPNVTPLFPPEIETPPSEQQSVSQSPAATKSTPSYFFQKLKQPEAADIVRQLRA